MLRFIASRTARLHIFRTSLRSVLSSVVVVNTFIGMVVEPSFALTDGERKFHWSEYNVKVTILQEANPGRGVIQKRVWHERLPTSPDFDELSKDWKECTIKNWHDTKLGGNLTKSSTRSEVLTQTCTARTSSKATL